MTNQVTENIKEFILGGKAEFTILQQATSKTPEIQMKYKIKASKPNNNHNKVWYISTEIAKNSDDVTTDGRNLVYQGFLTKDLVFKVGEKGVQDFNKQAIKGLLWVLKHSEELPEVVKIYHHDKCSVCGKKLTDAKSLRCGIGPTCRKKSVV